MHQERSPEMSGIREAIAENITELRLGANMTQSRLADILNYSDKAVSKWERGEAVPDIAVLKQIADYFGVSVDYLLTKSHDGSEIPSDKHSLVKRKNHLIVSCLAVSLVWLFAMLMFVVLALIPLRAPWTLFIGALPASAVVALVFNSIWGIRRLNFLIVSVLIWTLILALHIFFYVYLCQNLWMLYLVGIPGQIIVFLASGIKFKKN